MGKQDNLNEKKETETTDTRKQKISPTYTLRAFGENLKRLYELELLTLEEAKEGAVLVTAARNRYMSEELNFN